MRIGEQLKVARADKSGEPAPLTALGGCLKSLPADAPVGTGHQALQGSTMGFTGWKQSLAPAVLPRPVPSVEQTSEKPCSREEG